MRVQETGVAECGEKGALQKDRTGYPFCLSVGGIEGGLLLSGFLTALDAYGLESFAQRRGETLATLKRN